MDLGDPLPVLRGFHERDRLRDGLRPEVCEVLQHKGHRSAGLDPADDREDRVVRSVMAEVVCVHLVPTHRLEVLPVPDWKPVVRVDMERGPPHLLLDEELRLVFRTLALRDHNGALRGELLRVERGIPHPLGLNEKGRLELVRGHRFVIHCPVLVRGSVEVAANPRDESVDVPLRELPAALE